MAQQVPAPAIRTEPLQVQYDLVAIDDAGAALYRLHSEPIPVTYRLLRPDEEQTEAWDVPSLGGIIRPRHAPIGCWRWLTGPDRRAWGRRREPNPGPPEAA